MNEYHRNISDEDFLNDMRRVADMVHSQILTIETYNKYGKYHNSTISHRFGSWKEAISRAGLRTRHGSLKNINNDNVTNEQLLQDLKMTANLLGLSSITCTQYDDYGKHGHQIIIARFKKWENALLKAGIEPTGFHSKVTIEELLEDLERVWITLGRQPTATDIKKGVSHYSLNSYSRKFGSWRKALEYFVKYINNDNNCNVEELKPNDKTITSNAKDSEPNIKLRRTNRDINLRLRFKVFQRDNFKCCICGRSPATTQGLELQVDHIKPWSKGGETTLENLQTLCRDCNLGKSNLE